MTFVHPVRLRLRLSPLHDGVLCPKVCLAGVRVKPDPLRRPGCTAPQAQHVPHPYLPVGGWSLTSEGVMTPELL